MKTVFLRILEADDKAAALRTAIKQPDGALGRQRFELNPLEFCSIPTSPFAYWVSSHIRNLFHKFPKFESKDPERRATKGLATTDDGQFLRVWWELQPQRLADVWYSFARGGRTSPFYSDLSTYVFWQNDGVRLKAFLDHKIGKDGQWSRWINSTDHYERAGLTWTLRASRFSPQALPKNSVFSVRGYAAFSYENDLLAMLAVFNSSVFDYLFKLALGRFGHPEFVVGVLQWLPWAESGIRADNNQLGHLARRAWSLKRSLDTRTETSHAFTLPALLQIKDGVLAARAEVWANHVRSIEAELISIQSEIDTRCFDLYGIDKADRGIITQASGANISENPDIESDGDTNAEADADMDEADDSQDNSDVVNLAAELGSWAVGVAFGRFDLRVATGTISLAKEPEPFDPLPACSPAMLTGDDGAPLTTPPAGYPIAFPENGLLVDDPGHPRDLTTAAHVVFEKLFEVNADAWWNDVAALLGAKDHDLRGWLATGFFESHLKRHSKGRRKAPIIWQIAVPSRRYSVWVYAYHVSRDTFIQIQNDIVTPKLVHEESHLTSLMQSAGANSNTKERKEIEAQEAFVEELREMLDEVKRVAPLWHPSLDDGVVLTMAPLWRLMPQHKPWQKEVKSKWNELVSGQYDWTHLAMHLWPERVVPKCVEDRSLAIAHGLEKDFWFEDKDGKWKPYEKPQRLVQDLVRERTSTAVKAALKSLLDAPESAATTKRGRKTKAA